jgi:hypothetical protein
MAKTKISEYSSTSADNTDISNINIAEGCSPANVNNAIRTVMAQLKDQQTGASGDNFTVGGNLSVTGTSTLTGDVTAPTQTSSDNSTKVATTAFVTTKVGTLGTMASQNANAVTISGGTISGITDLTVADGGTGASTLSANAVLLGNGTSALQTVAPSTSGNVLTSNGTTWTSATPAGIGVGQTWTNVTGSRSYGTTYTNSTGKPIYVSVSGASTSPAGGGIQFYIGGTLIAQQGATQSASILSYHNITMIVPDGITYSANAIPGGGGQGGSSLQQWFELR